MKYLNSKCIYLFIYLDFIFIYLFFFVGGKNDLCNWFIETIKYLFWKFQIKNFISKSFIFMDYLFHFNIV